MSRLWRTDERTDGKWKIEQCSVGPETAIRRCFMSSWVVFINIALHLSIKEDFLVFKETERARCPTLKWPQSDRAIVTTPSQASGLLQKGQPGKEDVNQHKTKILFHGLKSNAITWPEDLSICISAFPHPPICPSVLLSSVATTHLFGKCGLLPLVWPVLYIHIPHSTSFAYRDEFHWSSHPLVSCSTNFMPLKFLTCQVFLCWWLLYLPGLWLVLPRTRNPSNPMNCPGLHFIPDCYETARQP